jgi:hypothetical protein
VATRADEAAVASEDIVMEPRLRTGETGDKMHQYPYEQVYVA